MKNLLFLAVAALLGSCAPADRPAATPFAPGEGITLQRPAREGGLTVDGALWERRSWREFTQEPLTLEEVSGVMWAAAGVNRDDGRRTAPSALGRYPIRVYAFFAEGVYAYDPAANRLTRVAEGDHRALTGMQPFVAEAQMNLVYLSDAAAYAGHAVPEEQYRILCGMDAAGCAENVNLYAAGHDLRAITRGSAQGDKLLALLGLPADRYAFVLAQSVGK